MSDLASVWVVEISYGNEEKETLHMKSETQPTHNEIEELVKPYIQKVWHESGDFEIDEVYNIQDSIDRLLSFSK